jgi:hypothetical protein
LNMAGRTCWTSRQRRRLDGSATGRDHASSENVRSVSAEQPGRAGCVIEWHTHGACRAASRATCAARAHFRKEQAGRCNPAKALRTLPDFASSARYCAHMAGTTRPRLGEYKIKSPPSLPAPCAPTSSFVAHAEQLNALLEWALCHDTAQSSSLRPSADKDHERMDGLAPATKASASCAESYDQTEHNAFEHTDNACRFHLCTPSAN